LHTPRFGGRQGGYDQSDLPDVISFCRKLLSAYFAEKKMITKYITK